MTEHVEQSAQISIARGSAFGGLAILCTMIGLSAMPVVALKAGGILSLIAALVLAGKAEMAPYRSFKRTEVWLMLDESKRPPAAIAQQVIGSVLQNVCRRFAALYAAAAVWMLAGSLVLGLAL